MREIWHPWHTWECHRAGMFAPASAALPMDEGQARYAEFLSDFTRFEQALGRVIAEWPISCEHFLTKRSMNRIAWLGQSSMCIETGVSRAYRGGFRLLSELDQATANAVAERGLNQWIASRG